eukprot:6478337-Amphidinium_carterae.1
MRTQLTFPPALDEQTHSVIRMSAVPLVFVCPVAGSSSMPAGMKSGSQSTQRSYIDCLPTTEMTRGSKVFGQLISSAWLSTVFLLMPQVTRECRGRDASSKNCSSE